MFDRVQTTENWNFHLKKQKKITWTEVPTTILYCQFVIEWMWEQNGMVPESATQQSYGLVFYVKFSDIKYLYSIT